MQTKKSIMRFLLRKVVILAMLLTGCTAPAATAVSPGAISATAVTQGVTAAAPTPGATATAATKLTVAATPVSPTPPINTPSATVAPTLPVPKPSQDNVPAPFRCYLNGVATKDLAATTACFDDQALVIDVGRRIEGKEAIQRWLNNEVMGLKYEVESVTTRQEGAVVIVKINLSSGSGFRAKYDMDFKNGRILKMDLQYA